MNTRILGLSSKTTVMSDIVVTTAVFTNNKKTGNLLASLSKSDNSILIPSVTWNAFTFYKDTTAKNSRDTNNFTINEKNMIEELSDLTSINITDFIYG